MNIRQHQAGMSIPGILVIAAMVGFFVMCTIRLAPPYFEYLSVKKIVTTIAEEHDPEQESLSKIRRRIATTFNTNQIYHLQPKEVKVYREEGETFIDANYEVRVPMVGSVDAIISFDDLKIVAGK